MNSFQNTRSKCFLIAASLLASGCGPRNEYKPPPPPEVTVAKPIVQTVTDYLEETGTTEAVEMVSIRARVSGFLEEMKFVEGDPVEAGQLLYVIEKDEYVAARDAAQADQALAQVAVIQTESEFVRQDGLLKENATSKSDWEKARAAKDSAIASRDKAKAAFDRAALDLKYTEVRTPIAGRVGKTLVKVGNLVGGGEATHLTTVVNYDPIYANFNISESDFLAINDRRQGAAADQDDVEKSKKPDVNFYLRRTNDQGYPFVGKFEYADLAVDQSTGTYMIRGTFPNPDLKIVPGLFVRIRIPIGKTENALLVPRAAISFDQEGRYLLVVNSENKVERRNVALGTEIGDMQVISDGLTADQRVIVSGVQRAREGMLVAPVETTLPPLEGDGTVVRGSAADEDGNGGEPKTPQAADPTGGPMPKQSPDEEPQPSADNP